MKKFCGILVIAFVMLSSCVVESKERFFTQEESENEFNQLVNIDVLERIKNDSTITKDEMIFSFYFITNKRVKIDSLIYYLKNNEPRQTIIELNKINEIWELNGRTYPIKLEIDSLNSWEKKMWEIGFQFDCKLVNWETTYANRND